MLSRCASEVCTHRELADWRLRKLGYDNVHVRHGDGMLGWPERALGAQGWGGPVPL